MIAINVLVCIFLFFALILSLKAKITVIYNGEIVLFLKILGIKIKILPKKARKKGPHSMSEKKAQKIKAKLEEKAKKKAAKKSIKDQEKSKAKLSGKPRPKKSISEILDVISAIKDIASRVIKVFFKHLRIDLARCHIAVATGDAATTAIAYGAICDASLHLFHVLEGVKGFDLPARQDFSISADYLSEQTKIDIKISFSIRVWHVLHAAFAALKAFVANTINGKLSIGKKHKTK